jgi:hypothetical protein
MLIQRYFFCSKALLLAFISMSMMASTIAFAQESPLEPISTLNAKIEFNKVFPENLTDIKLDIKEVEKHQLREEAPEVALDDKIKLTPEEAELKSALEFQKANDIEDVEYLWNATLERNAVIRFALDKIATPPEKRAVKSSLMARAVSTMIQGTAILPTLFGMGAATEYTSAFGGQIINNAFSKKFVPQQGMPSITEPELIQLTSFIEELQNNLIKTYFNYKNALESLMLERKNLSLQEQNYKKALESKDQTAIIIASALYDKSRQAELRIRQQVKVHRVELERHAGIDAVSQLNLTLPEKLIQAKYSFELNPTIKKALDSQGESVMKPDKAGSGEKAPDTQEETQTSENTNVSEKPEITDEDSKGEGIHE